MGHYWPLKGVHAYLLVDLVTPAQGAVVDGVDGALVIPGQLGRMKRQVGLHGLVESIRQTLKNDNDKEVKGEYFLQALL